MAVAGGDLGGHDDRPYRRSPRPGRRTTAFHAWGDVTSAPGRAGSVVRVTASADTADLEERISHLASVPQLLVACDYDGTVAPIVDDPMKALPRLETVIALRALANLPQTQVAIISGRSGFDLVLALVCPVDGGAADAGPDDERKKNSHCSFCQS
jgi:hypothetical protein